ncbi:MAG: NmrA family protein [Blastococcus sp.]|nr:NmrA family protein [Blastococcus sp.]
MTDSRISRGRSSDAVTAVGMAATMPKVSGRSCRTPRVGSVNGFPRLIPLVRRVAPNRPYPVFPAWQGMQYLLDVLSDAVRLAPPDHDRYAGLRWTSLHDRFTSDYLPGSDRQRKEDL